MLDYLKSFHQDDITNLLNDGNDCLHVSVNVNLTQLHRTRPELFAQILKNVWEIRSQWDQALLEAQKELIEGNCFLEAGYQVKENCHVRFINLPQVGVVSKGSFPGIGQIRQFVQVKGNVIRMTQGRILEFKREYQCSRCKAVFTLAALYSDKYVFDLPKKCLSSMGTCKGNLYPKNPQPKSEYCMDYQEIRLQELVSDKGIPASLVVSLENDLVDYCMPGDCVTVCGTMEVRWPQLTEGNRFEVAIVLRAIGVYKDAEKINFLKDLSEQLVWVRAKWQDTIDAIGHLNARDMIVRSICPEIHGMYLVKLAVALALCSGVQCTVAGANKRGSSHLLLVGDPGLAKSKLLKAASTIALRSVHTTGMGCSSAGLTAAAIKDDGEWQLEAGALVLADGGICCIDEFNLMSEADKGSMHEAMEQQTISLAKAGMVCRLSTQCTVLAASNPKNLHKMSEAEGTTPINIGIGSPLLSRFDIVLILRDKYDQAWDSQIADHVLENVNRKSNSDSSTWELERLQSHFLAVQEIYPELTAEANRILGSYYNFCRSDPMRDLSRTTTRLLESLNRLGQAHARLMFRDKVEAVDACMVIRLMEGSWGFGRLWPIVDILREALPLGPDEKQIQEVMKLLQLESLQESVMNNLHALNTTFDESRSEKAGKNVKGPLIGNLENLFGFKKDSMKRLESNRDEQNENLNDSLTNLSNQRISPAVTKNNSKKQEASSQKIINSDKNLSRTRLFDEPINLDCVERSPKKAARTKTNAIGNHPIDSLAVPNKSTADDPVKQNKTAIFNRMIQQLDDIDNIDLELPDFPSNSQKTSRINQMQGPSKKTSEKPENKRSQPSVSSVFLQAPSLNETKSSNLDRMISQLDDIDDIDLELSIPTSNSQKSNHSSQLQKKRIEPEKSPTKKTSESPRTESKKPRLSEGTLAKLNRFMNPNCLDKTGDTAKASTSSGEVTTRKQQNESSEDSAYQSNIAAGSCMSLLDDNDDNDLRYLDFDI